MLEYTGHTMTSLYYKYDSTEGTAQELSLDLLKNKFLQLNGIQEFEVAIPVKDGVQQIYIFVEGVSEGTSTSGRKTAMGKVSVSQ
jgi:hypothetical protein